MKKPTKPTKTVKTLGKRPVPTPAKAPPAKPVKPPRSGVRKTAPITPPRESKGAVKVSMAQTNKGAKSKTYAERVKAAEQGDNVQVVKNKTQAARDPWALPDMDAMLPDLSLSLNDIEFPDPEADAASELRKFGPELEESPLDEDDETMSNEDQEALRLAQLHQGFRERMKNEAKRRAIATDAEYWLCVVFQDRDQKDQFLRATGWETLGDKYLDGERLADRMGVAIDKSEIVYNIGGADPKLSALVGIDPAYGGEPESKLKRKGSR